MKYVVSDIHGNMEAWESIKSQIMLGKKDELYVLGDVIDRGSFGIEILEEIMRKPNMHMILGNHEYMMMNALGFPYVQDDPEYVNKNQVNRFMLWNHNGAKPTYSDWKYLNAIEKGEIIEFLKGLPLHREVEVNGNTFVLVHANSAELIESIIKQNVTMDDNRLAKITYFAVWDRDYLSLANSFYKLVGKTMIFGHTPTISFDPEMNELDNNDTYLSVFANDHLIGIDCGAGWGENQYSGFKGRLSCICLDTMEIFYSR